MRYICAGQHLRVSLLVCSEAWSMSKDSRYLAGLVTFVAMMLSPVMVAAQEQSKGDMFIGYAYARATLDSGNYFNPQGIAWSNDFNLKAWMAITVKTDDYWGSALVPYCRGSSCVVFGPKNTAALNTVMAGLRLAKTSGRITSFARAVFGIALLNGCPPLGCESKLSYAQEFGGGVQVRITERRLGWRFEGGLLQTHFFGAWQNDFRLATGPVIYFYRRR